MTIRTVLYVCATSSDGAREAASEGQRIAFLRGFDLVDTITDPYGEIDPANRGGWQQLMKRVEAHDVDLVLTRWPYSISRDDTVRHETVNTITERGARVLYSWPVQDPPRPGGPQ